MRHGEYADITLEFFRAGLDILDMTLADFEIGKAREQMIAILRREVAAVLQKLVHCYESQCAYEQAIAYVQRWLALDRMHEPVHRTLMRLFASAGQQAAALRQYDECVRILADELGVPPEEKTILQ